MAQNFWTAIWAFSTNFVLTIIISLMTKPRPEPELVGLVYSLTPKPVEHHMAWYARPKMIALGLIVMLVALNLIFK
jgi:SSS family solute:Na+ symporter